MHKELLAQQQPLDFSFLLSLVRRMSEQVGHANFSSIFSGFSPLRVDQIRCSVDLLKGKVNLLDKAKGLTPLRHLHVIGDGTAGRH